MKRSIRVKWGELKVGLLIVLAILILIWASFVGGGTSIFEPKTTYTAYFSNVNGLVTGAPVWIAGVEVGNVTSIKFVNLDSARQIEVKFRVKESITKMITEDAAVTLGTIGFLGDKYIEIIPGTLGKPIIPTGSVVRTMSASDAAALMAEGGKAMTSARNLTENLTEITDKIKMGEGTAGQFFTNDTLYHEMTKLLSAMTVLVRDMQVSQRELTTSINGVARNVDTLTSQINSGRGTLGKLVSNPELYDNLKSSAGRIDSILAKIDRGQGTAGGLVNDDSLYVEIRNLVGRVNSMVADMQKNPRKYFKFSVF